MKESLSFTSLFSDAWASKQTADQLRKVRLVRVIPFVSNHSHGLFAIKLPQFLLFG